MEKNNDKIASGFHHIAIKVKDFDAALKFYTDGLGFDEKAVWVSPKTGKRVAMIDVGENSYFEVFEDLEYEPKPDDAVVHIALRTDNCDQAIERARAAGAEITMEPKDMTLGSNPPNVIRIGFFKGPGGESVEFLQSKGWF